MSHNIRERVLYEWRTKRRQIKFCYACRMLKNKKEFYIRNKKNGKYQYKSLDILCKYCTSIYKKQNYKIKKGGK